MEDPASKKVLEFYMKANSNKEKLFTLSEPRRYSLAEDTVMACIDELLMGGPDKEKRIRFLLLNSLYGQMDGLKKKDEYEKFLFESDIVPKPCYSERARNKALGLYKESEDTFDNYLKLREKIRQGHIYWSAKGERLESIIEHIYGCIVLILGIESEYGYDLDYDRIIKMLLLHETEEIIIGDLTEWDITPEEKKRRGKEAVTKLLSGLANGEELLGYIKEFEDKRTVESDYANLCDKLEYDMQVKVYDLQGRYDFEHYPDNVVTRSERVQEIIHNGATSVFDVHYEYDKNRYYSIPCLRRILEETKKL